MFYYSPCIKFLFQSNMNSTNQHGILHPDILEIILLKVKNKSLLNARLVSKTWNKMLQNPNYWEWSCITLNKENLDERIESNFCEKA